MSVEITKRPSRACSTVFSTGRGLIFDADTCFALLGCRFLLSFCWSRVRCLFLEALRVLDYRGFLVLHGEVRYARRSSAIPVLHSAWV